MPKTFVVDPRRVVWDLAEADALRLRKAGFAPVVRWVDVANKQDAPLKTIEALTVLDRREAASRKKGT